MYRESTMCGRAYATYTEDELRARYLNRQAPRWGALKPNYNLAPTQQAPVVRTVKEQIQLDLFRWQYVAPWEPEFKTKLSTINAKSETVFTSRLFRESILQRRCIVPVSGFFEWQPGVDGKRPYKIFLPEEPIMSLAGIWVEWGQPEARRGSFAILTTGANDFMKPIHSRMPVILNRGDEAAWLDPKMDQKEAILKYLQPCASERIRAVEVSRRVNSPAHNSPEVLEPLASG